MSTIVITGANRGIGLALARHYAAAGDHVVGLCRAPDRADDLHALAAAHDGRVTLGRIDLADRATIKAAAEGIEGPVDLLVNNAGIIGGTDQSLAAIDLDAWEQAFRVMAIGPFLVTRAFLPALADAHGKVVFVSSQLAASTWPHGGFYAYGSAKAAGNRVAQILAIDCKDKGVSIVSVHPGYVQTDMGGPAADITPAESAAGIAGVVERLTLATSGGFMSWTGEPHPL